MKILQITFSLSSGGAERFLVDLSNELSKTNDVTVLALKEDKSNPESQLFYKFDLSDRVSYKNLELSNTSYSPLSMWKVYKTIKAENPDIVHVHGAGMPRFYYLASLLLGKRITFVQTIHNDIHNGYDTFIYKFVYRTLAKQRLIRFAALSATNYKELTRIYPKALATCIVNGRAPIVPTSEFEVVKSEIASYKTDNNTIVVLHVARCNKQKNQHLLIDAFNKISRDGLNAVLLIIGAGYESELGNELRRKACNNIHFLGTRRNIGDYMLNSDVFTLSSSFEGMPITLLEAALCGVPMVSTPVCGAVDIINGKNGKVSEDYTITSYSNALLSVLNNLSYYKENARETDSNTPYTIAYCAEKYLAFYK